MTRIFNRFGFVRSLFRSRYVFLFGFLLFLCFIIKSFREESVLEIVNYNTDKILRAIEPATQDVVLPKNDTIILEPWETKACQNFGQSQYLLLMYISSPENAEQRNLIRARSKENVLAWKRAAIFQASSYQVNEATIKTLFFVGQPTNGATTMDNLLEEGHNNGDLIIDDFQESYLNLTVKTLRMLKWVEGNCGHVAYLVKVDDDVFLNLPALLTFLQNYNSSTGPDLIAGHNYKHIAIDSDPYSKWYTPKFLWGKAFPNFASGVCYILGSRVRSVLYNNALNVNLFHLEDVFLTGIVRERFTSVDVVHAAVYPWWSFSWRMSLPCNVYHNVVAIHQLSSKESKCYNMLHSLCEKHPYIPLILLCST